MLSDNLGKVYAKIEDKWFSLLEFLQAKGLPAYSYADFLEGKGVPSLPFTIAVFLLAFALVFGLMASSDVNVKIRLNIVDEHNNSLSMVNVEFVDADDRIVKTVSSAHSGQEIELGRVPVGARLLVRASKSGYMSAETSVGIDSSNVSAALRLESVAEKITGSIELLDKETRSTVFNADCRVVVGRSEIKGDRGPEGRIDFYGVPENTQVELNCSASGYEQINEVLRFRKDETVSFDLVPSSTAGFQDLTDILIIIRDEQTGEHIQNAGIKIINVETDAVISDIETPTGEFFERINHGTHIKIIVEKEGFKTLMDEFTVREEEHVREFWLERGGTFLEVEVFSIAGARQVNADVTLFDKNFYLIDSKKTDHSGIAFFDGLMSGVPFFVTAFKDGFLPAFVPVESAGRTVEAYMETATENNSAFVTLKVLDGYENKVNNATVRFYRLVDDSIVPLGIPSKKTNLNGVVSHTLPAGSIVAEVETGESIAFKEMEVIAGQKPEFEVVMERKPEIVELTLVDENKELVKGYAIIASKDKEVLFEGETDGIISFNSMGHDSFLLAVQLEDGRIFEREVRAEGEQEIEVRIGESVEGVAPEIEFAGIINAKGENIDGITANEYAWVLFEAGFSQGEKAGMHVRVGEDNVSYADSQEIGIFGFDGNVSGFVYGTSYQPPFGQSADLANKGNAGEKNKWLELYFDEAPANVVIGVKVKASNIGREESFEVHYRAWSEIGGRFFRAPEDEALGKEKSSSEKQALYADTKSASIKMFEGDSECAEELCIDLLFVDENGLKRQAKEFSAVEGRKYALQATLTTAMGTVADISFRALNERIAFSEIIEGEDFFAFDEFNKREVSRQVGVEEKKVLRAFFQAGEQGPGSIEVLALDHNISKKTNFNISGEKEFEVVLNKKGFISAGESLDVRVRDRESGEAVEDAFIALKKENEVIESVKGENAEGKGLNGNYLIETENLGPGKYTLTINRNGYREAEYPVVIGAEEILKLQPEINVSFERGEREKVVRPEISNLSDSTVENIVHEIKSRGTELEDFDIDVSAPQQLGPRGSANIAIRIRYTGAEEKRVFAEADLKLRGSIGVTAEAESTIKISYNKEVPGECIEIEPEELSVSFNGMPNSSETINLRVSYREGENCTKPLNFSLRHETDAQGIELASRGFEISPGETKDFEVKLINKIERAGVFEEKKDSTLFLDSPEITKSLKLGMQFTDPRFALQSNDNIVIYMSADPRTGVIEGAAPLFVKNFGDRQIEALQWSIREPSRIDMYVLPSNGLSYEQAREQYLQRPGDLPITMFSPESAYLHGNPAMDRARLADVLRPGQEIEPRTIYATSTALDLDRGPHEAKIVLTGTMDGMQFEKTITAWVIVSTAECVRIAPVDEMYFQSTESAHGVITRNITIRNECGEMLRSLSIEPEMLGRNTLSLYVLGDRRELMPDESVQAQIMLSKREDYFNTRRPDALKVRGFLVNSQQFTESNPIPTVVELGERAVDEAGPAFKEMDVQVCEESSGVKQTISFPLVSTDGECASGYCDAVQMSEFIVKKIDETVAGVERILDSKGERVANYPLCSQDSDFCSFSMMGLVPEGHTVYLSNDNISKDLLEREARNSQLLAPFSADYYAGDISDLVAGATGATAQRLFLNEPMTGCGRYRISIQGAMQNIQGSFERDRFFILVKISGERELTPECTARVQNIMNFLPKDEGIRPHNSYNTWFGATQGTEETEGIAREFAQTLFDSEGRADTGISTNILEIKLGEIARGGVMKLSIPQVSYSEPMPVSSVAQINRVFGISDEAMQSQIISKAREGLSRVAKGSFALDGCISRDQSYMIIEEFEDLGDIKIEGDIDTELYYGLASCADLNVISEISELVELRTDWEFLTENEKAGIKEVWLEAGGERIEEYSDIESGTALELEHDENTASYRKAFSLCVLPDDEYLDYAAFKEIKVKARSASFAGKEMRHWHSVTLNICGVHPYDLVRKMNDVRVEPGEEKVFYATVGWSGEPDKIDMRGITRGLVAEDRQNRARELIEETGQGGRIDDSPIGKKVLGLKAQGYGIYAGACIGASLGCHLATRGWLPITWPSIAFSVFMDCGPAATAGYLSTTKGGQGLLAGVSNAWDSTKETLSVLWGGPATAVDPIMPSGEGLYGEAMEEFADDVIPAAILGAEADLIRTAAGQYMLANNLTNTTIGRASIRLPTISNELSRDLTNRFADEMLAGVTPQARTDLTKALRESLNENITTTLQASKQQTFRQVLGSEDVMTGVWNQSLGSDSFTDSLASHSNHLGTSELKEILSGPLSNPSTLFADDVFTQSIPDLQPYRIIKKGKPTGMLTNDLAQDMAYRLTDNMRLYEVMPQDADTIRGALTTKLQDSLSGRTTLDEGSLKRILKSSLDDVAKNNTEFINAYKREMGENLFRRIDDVSFKGAAPKKNIFRRLFDTFRRPEFYYRLVRGMACAATGNFAGYYFFNRHVEGGIESLQARGVIAPPGVEFGDYEDLVANYSGEGVIHNNRTYKITAGMDDYGNPYYRVSIVGTPEAFEEMRQTLKERPEALWQVDCREYRERGVSSLVGFLVPEAGGVIKPVHAIAYYNNSGLVREASETYNVQEALLMAALTIQPDNFLGCRLEEDWYRGEESEIRNTVECVARTISEKLAIAGDGYERQDIIDAFEMLSRDHARANRYALDIESAYREWNNYNIRERDA